MLVILRKDATAEDRDAVADAIRRQGYQPVPVPGPSRTALCVTGNTGPVDPAPLARLPGVLECLPVTKPYKLVSREVHPDDTVVTVGDVAIGGPRPIVIAGPCSVETEARTVEIAHAVRAAGATLFRAGAYKPRTSPYAFGGLGAEGLTTLRRVREEVGLPVVTEVLDTGTVELVAEHADVLQVGTRNMHNVALLRRLARVDRPVLLKRGMSATLDEWLMAAEYLLAEGHGRVILCERGIRTFARHSRNTLDLNVVPLVRRLCHLPILVDPSHGVGARDRVRAMSRAALAAGAHGLLVEAHVRPERAYSDGDQTIDAGTLAGIGRDAAVLAHLEPLDGRGADAEPAAALGAAS